MNDFQRPARTNFVPATAIAGLVLGCMLPAASSAQDAADADAQIIVSGVRVLFPMPPERVLNEADVSSYGLSTVGEVLDEVAQENGETRSDPLFLINGRRVSGLGEVEDLPAEALAQVEVLPLGSALRVGGGADQRVYNIQLKSELSLTVARAAARVAAGGHFVGGRGDLTQTYIQGDRRIAFSAKGRSDGLLREDDAGVLQIAGSAPNSGKLRSLSPATNALNVSVAAADRLAPWLFGSLNAKASSVQRRALLGPSGAPGDDDPLRQRGLTRSLSTDLTLVADIGTWQLSALGSYEHSARRSQSDRPAGGAASVSSSRVDDLNGLLTASGPAARLPAGDLRATLSAGAVSNAINGERTSGGAVARSSVKQTATFVSGGLVVPLTSRANGALGAVGDLSAGLELGRQHVDNFGSFTNRTVSLSWLPLERLQVNASIARSDSAPSVELQGEPLLETVGVPYFDPVRNQTVDVTRITGGQSGLQRQRSRTLRVGANYKPSATLALQLTAEYLDTRDRNLTSQLPPASFGIIAAFPDRFVRDAQGTLVAVDLRPVNFAARGVKQLRTGFILSLPLGGGSIAPARAEGDADSAAEGPAAGRGGGARVQFSASYVRVLQSELKIAAGSPTIDLLSREAVGFGGLGTPRHRVDASIGYSARGMGVRLNSQFRSASFIEASGATANVLRFAPLATLAVRSWIQADRLFSGEAWAKGLRLTASLTHLTGVRERVVDSFGNTPLAYQPAYRDPLGRTFEIEVRKTF